MQIGATTLNIMTLTTTTLSKTTFSRTKKCDTQHNDTALLMLSVIYAECHMQALYDECRYTECHGASRIGILLMLPKGSFTLTDLLAKLSGVSRRDYNTPIHLG
jgi:hypothetical protein